MVTQNKTLTERDLEVAVLDRTKERRKFRRIPAEALAPAPRHGHVSVLRGQS